MAYELNYWRMEGASDICLKTVRLKRLADIEYYRLIESRPSQTDMISRDRTDNESHYFQVLWESPNYKSLDYRAK